jgi:hypothetical protein
MSLLERGALRREELAEPLHALAGVRLSSRRAEPGAS